MPRLIKNSDFVLYLQGKVRSALSYVVPDIWIVSSAEVAAVASALNLQVTGPDLELTECPDVWDTDADTSSLISLITPYVSFISQNN